MKSFHEWLMVIDRSQSEYDPVIVDILVESYGKTNGADDGEVLEQLVSQTPREQAKIMRDYYARWRQEEPPVPKWAGAWDADTLGRKVRRVYIATDLFIIYSVKDAELEDLCGLKYELAGRYSHCQVLRGRLAELKPDIAGITDALPSIRPMLSREHSRASEDYKVFRERMCEMVAQAMSSALEDRLDQARSIIAEARAIVEERRDSLNRMRYILANSASTAVILVGGCLLTVFGTSTPFVPLVTVDDAAVPWIPVLMAGTLGAFFSVSISIRQLKVNRSITLLEMLYAGFVRVPIGAIAALAIVFLIAGGWVLGAVAREFMPASVLLLAFVAGFSEMFVPNLLNQVQDQNRAQKPDEPRRPAPVSGG